VSRQATRRELHPVREALRALRVRAWSSPTRKNTARRARQSRRIVRYLPTGATRLSLIVGRRRAAVSEADL